MTTKTIKVAEATNMQLNWLVAKCEGLNPNTDYQAPERFGLLPGWRDADGFGYGIKSYTTDPAQMWPIIENMVSDGFELKRATFSAAFQCIRVGGDTVVAGFGPTLLIAAARCYVVSKLGEAVEVPEELTCP